MNLNVTDSICVFSKKNILKGDGKLNILSFNSPYDFKEAESKNNNKNKIYCGIVQYPCCNTYFPISIKFFREKYPLTPLFVTEDAMQNMQKIEEKKINFKELSFTKVISPNFTLEDLFLLIEEEKKEFLLKNQTSIALNDKINQESSLKNSDFIELKTNSIPLGNTSYFDLYIKLRNDKYLKILNSGEIIPKAQIERYKSKGLESIFLPKDQHFKLLKYCDYLIEKIEKKIKNNPEIYKENVLNLGDQIIKNLYEQGVNSENLEFAKNFLAKSIDLMQKIKTSSRHSNVLETILDFISKSEHSVSVSILCGILIKNYDFTSAAKINIISLASLLHDVGFLDLEKNIQNFHSLEDHSSSCFLEYKKHAELGALKLQKIKEIPETVIQAILQHHERKDGSGFPKGIAGHSLNFIAQLIGICDEYVYSCSNYQEKGHKAFLESLEKELKPKFSPELIKKFISIFK